MTAAIFFHPEAYSTRGPRLMGRNAAGESFLRGFFQHHKSPEFWVQVLVADHAQFFANIASGHGRTEPVKVVDRSNVAALAQAGLVYYPGPGIGNHAWQRNVISPSAWSLCGITHTTSSAAAMDALADLVVAPVQPWDAVICTSTSVKYNVESVLDRQTEHLANRLGITRRVLPQLPVIPLGIHTIDFKFTTSQKTFARKSLAVDEHAVIVLYVGRLSFHAKAHPLAMYQAIEAAAQSTGKSIVLIECGWHANESISRAYQEAARVACPSVRVVTLNGRDSEARLIAWSAADVFCSLSDNIQETFGITPIEAMASGLPVIVSDWDGYRDTVRDGVDGFRIPTLMPGNGLGIDLAFRHAVEVDTYDMYCGHVCSLVAVDVDAASEAFKRLFISADLRQQMGEAGQRRARDLFDWARIIPRYEELWTELSSIRTRQTQNSVLIAGQWPNRMDPFQTFAAYPTRQLTEQTRVALVDETAERALARTLLYRELAMVDFAREVIPTLAEIEMVLSTATLGPMSAASLVGSVSQERQAFVFRSLAWLIKLGILRVVP